MDTRLKKRLLAPLDERKKDGLEREVRLFDSRESMVDLSNNDYLGLAAHPKVKAAAQEAIERYGCSSSASPLITGFGPVHQKLLDRLLEWHGFEDGMIWNTGYAANQAVLSTLPQKSDLVLADRLIHNSMVTGVLRSGSRFIRYPHCSVEALEKLLEKEGGKDRVVFVVTESVFSMDGDYPDLAGIAALKQRYPFFWIVDEAHALGWYGEKGSGLVEEYGVQDQVDLLVGTMGKGLGSMGAYTLFREPVLRRYFENFAGEFIYSTYLAPSAAAAGEAAVKLIQEMGDERREAREASVALRRRLREVGLDVPSGDAPIIPVLMGEAESVLDAAARLETEGIRVGAIRPPTVPRGQSRLRISLNTKMSPELYDKLFDALKGFGEGRDQG